MAVASAGPYASLSAPRSRQMTTPATHQSVFYRPDALPAAQPTASKHKTAQITAKISASLRLSVSDVNFPTMANLRYGGLIRLMFHAQALNINAINRQIADSTSIVFAQNEQAQRMKHNTDRVTWTDNVDFLITAP